MKTLRLHNIARRFPNDLAFEATTFECEPDHLPALMRGEYRFLRQEGCSPRAARWHVNRMFDFLRNGLAWHVRDASIPLEWRLRVEWEDDVDFSYLDQPEFADTSADDLCAYWVSTQFREPDTEEWATEDGLGNVHVMAEHGDLTGTYESRATCPPALRSYWDDMLGKVLPAQCGHEGFTYTRSDEPDVWRCSGCNIEVNSRA